MLTEAQVQRSFGQLFQGNEVTDESFERAEQLIDQLRPESPLRHRLSEMLKEIRNSTATS